MDITQQKHRLKEAIRERIMNMSDNDRNESSR